MKDGYDIVEKLIDKTLDGDMEWMVGQTTCYSKINITDKKYLSYKIGSSFNKGRYEKSLTIKLSTNRLTIPIAILYTNKYRRIYDLEVFVREKL